MNAVERMIGLLPATALRRLGRRDLDESARALRTKWRRDLCGLLNAMTRGELAHVAGTLRLDTAGKSFELRMRLWERGAEWERCGEVVSTWVQPRPVLLGGHLVVQAPMRGVAPGGLLPRAVPAPQVPRPPDDEPDSLDELLEAADRLLGVRLGARGADKGAWGMRAASLLGVEERGIDEPDWRGDVEIKTVPVEREASGLWRVTEDPAIAMTQPHALAKLQHTLWLARTDVDGDDATIVSYYLLAWDPEVARCARRDLHLRPKGPAGTDQRGVYLKKRFFADVGFLASLNGFAA